MPYIEDRVATVEGDLSEIKETLAAHSEVLAGHTRSLTSLERNTALMRDDIAELKAGQIEIRDLLARVVARLEGVQT
jgi:septal ring factor EnvC (AmiA/AmiB activator)